jgi:predicted RNase H-like HicB family nuclease
MMNLHTFILRQSASYWVALCLENGIVGQGDTRDSAVAKLKEAIASFEEIYESPSKIYCAPVAIQELHEFLKVESQEPTSEVYEFRAVYA